MLKLNARRVYYILTTGNAFAETLKFSVFTLYYVITVGLDPFQLVLVGTVLEATAFLCEIPTGVLADRFSRRLSIIIGMGLTGLSVLAQLIAPDFGLILGCQVLWGVGLTFISGADNAWLADEVGEEQLGAVLVVGSQLSQLAGIIGLAGAVGLGVFDLRWPIGVSGVLTLGLTVFLIFEMPEDGFQRPTASNGGEKLGWRSMSSIFRTGWAAVRSRPVLGLLLAVEIFVGAASEGYDRLWEAHLLTNFSFPSFGNWPPVVWFALISLGYQVVSLLALQVVRRLNLNDQRLVVRLLLVTEGCSILARLVIGLAGSFEVALAAIWSRAVIGAVASPLYTTWLTRSIPSRVRATVLSMGSQLNALGQIAGGPAVGALGSAFSTRAAIAATGLLLMPNLVLYSRLAAHTQPTEAEPVLIER